VPVVVSNAVTAGDFMLGDWTMGATLYQREGITVRASESHSDLFVKNGVAILAEERAAFGIELPKAFTKGSFTIAS
jgi:HK97 family phage major capsid protein